MSGLFTQNDYHLAWFAVVDALKKIDPDFLLRKGTGTECAVEFIRELGEAKKKLEMLEQSCGNNIDVFTSMAKSLNNISISLDQYRLEALGCHKRLVAEGMPNVNQ